MRSIKVLEHEGVCANCKHFHQHYGTDNGRAFYMVNSGHCTRRDVKHRRPLFDKCKYFEEAEHERV